MSTKTEAKPEEPSKRKQISQPNQQEKSFKRPKIKGKKDVITPISSVPIQQPPIPSVGVPTIAIPPQAVFNQVMTDNLIRTVTSNSVAPNMQTFGLNLQNLQQLQGVQLPGTLPANLIQSMLGVPGMFTGNLNQANPSNQIPSPQTQNQVPLEQQITRQALLEQLRQQLPQNQSTLPNVPPVDPNAKPQDPRVQKTTNVVAAPKVLKTPTSPIPVQKSAHHEILRQHNEEYKMTQVKKSAVQLASTQYGSYAPYDSLHYNFVIPCLPVHLIEGYKSLNMEDST